MAKKKTQPDETRAAKELVHQPSTIGQLWGLVLRTIRAGCRPIIYGPPGVGKSRGLEAVCRRHVPGRFETLIGSQCAPEDLNGFPIEGPPTADAQGNKVPQTVFAVRDVFQKLNREGGVLFLDEFLCTSLATQATMLRLLAEGVAGDYALDLTRVALVAATNDADVAVNGTDLPAPMANRLVHLAFPTGAETVAEWCKDFPGYWGRPPKCVYLGETLPETEYMRARSFIAGFLTVRPPLWLDFPKDAAAQAGPWPSPRSWDAAARMIARTVADRERPAEAVDLVAGVVGAGSALEFLTYLENNDLPDPEAVLAEPQKFRPSGRPDVDHAVLTAVVEAVRAKCTPPRFEAACLVLGERTAGAGRSAESSAGPYLNLKDVWLANRDKMPASSHQAFNKNADHFKALIDLVTKG